MKDTKTIKWIFNKTKSNLLNFILLNVINIIYSFLSIYSILISKNLIDAATNGTSTELKAYILQLILVAILAITLRAILASIDAVTRAKLEINFKQNILETILKRNYEKITKFHSGDLMTRIVSDVDIIIDTLVSLIPSILSMITSLICAIILLFQISQQFVGILLLGGIILFVVINLLKPYLKNIHKKVQEANGNVRLFFKEVFENLLVIKIFQAENPILKKCDELQHKKYEIQMKQRSLSIASNTGLNAIFQIVYIYALVWSAYLLFKKNITVGGLTSIVQLVTQIQVPIISLSRCVQNVFNMIGSAERIIELENIEKDIIVDEIDSNQLYDNLDSIVIENVDFTYKNKKIFKQINLTVTKGQNIVIYGESGIGKSTLLKLILGIIKNDTGHIYFKLKDGSKQSINVDTRNMFSYVPQGKLILSGSIRENITFVNPNISDDDLDKALEISCCKSFIDQLEHGLDTKIGERGKGLSEGQLQRIAIARAIASKAPILILDEITSSLDSKTEEAVIQNIKNMKDITCIIVTHRNGVSKLCDKEYIVENKNMREKDKTNEGT